MSRIGKKRKAVIATILKALILISSFCVAVFIISIAVWEIKYGSEPAVMIGGFIIPLGLPIIIDDWFWKITCWEISR